MSSRESPPISPHRECPQAKGNMERQMLAVLVGSLCLVAIFAESAHSLRAQRSSSDETSAGRDQNRYFVKVKKWYDWNDSNLPIDKKWYDWQSIPSNDKRNEKRQFGNVLRNSRFEWNRL